MIHLIYVSMEVSYKSLIKESLLLDRSLHKMPENSLLLFENIKNKLEIKSFQRVKRENPINITNFDKQKGKLSDLFKLLNKLSEKNFEKISIEILNIIELFDADMKICDKFFEIINTNSVYTNLYAKMYKKIIDNNIIYYDILQNKIQLYLNEFNNIFYVSSNDDYDKYCLYIKQIENIKNFTKFMLECFYCDILQIDIIVSFIINFQEIVITNINDEEKLYINEAYISNILLIFSSLVDKIKITSQFDFIKKNHELLKKAEGSGKNKKISFKLMDISDLLNKK